MTDLQKIQTQRAKAFGEWAHYAEKANEFIEKANQAETRFNKLNNDVNRMKGEWGKSRTY